jgi:hypothetical protein
MPFHAFLGGVALICAFLGLIGYRADPPRLQTVALYAPS